MLGNEPICSVLWMPSGANRFCSRQTWGSRVATPLNFQTQTTGLIDVKPKSKHARLIADFDPDEWDLPPKPKWMRWRTYNRYVERFDT
jgi:hypothetical protein